MTRYEHCDENCTSDCGHCKGNPPIRLAHCMNLIEPEGYTWHLDRLP